MRQGLKDRIQFNPSNPSRMNMISTDYLLRNSFNNRIGNAFCAPNGTCSNVQDASGFWIRMDQNAQQTQRAYYAPFRQPIKGFRKVLDCSSGSPDISSCMLTTEIYKDNYAFPLVVGAAFAFGWTPCIGPVLGSILALSATETSIAKGILLLSFYSLGLAIPFILSGYYMSKFLTTRQGFSKYYGRVTKTGGTILLLTGILIATNQIQVISYYILTIFPILTTLG